MHFRTTAAALPSLDANLIEEDLGDALHDDDVGDPKEQDDAVKFECTRPQCPKVGATFKYESELKKHEGLKYHKNAK